MDKLPEHPHCPLNVINSLFAVALNAQAKQYNVPLPRKLYDFVQGENLTLGFEWHSNILDLLKSESKEVQTAWLPHIKLPLFVTELKNLINKK